MTTRTSRPLPALLFLALVAAGCGGGGIGAPCGDSGQTCCESQTCKSGLTCQAGTCGVPCGGQAQACCDGDRCSAGLTCNCPTGHNCVCGSPTNCAAEGDACCRYGTCMNGLYCTDGVCSKSKAEHSSFQGCSPGESCGNGATCVEAQYADGKGSGYFCSSPCNANGGCPGLEFSPSHGAVFCSDMTLGQCYVFCDTDMDCPAGTSCHIANLIKLCIPTAK